MTITQIRPNTAQPNLTLKSFSFRRASKQFPGSSAVEESSMYASFSSSNFDLRLRRVSNARAGFSKLFNRCAMQHLSSK